MLTKNSDLALDTKSLGDDGTFEGYGSVFGNVDSYGEIVEPGAFVASLAESKRKGRKVKLLWQHDSHQPIGIWEDLAEDAKGLWGKGRLLVEESPKARETHGLLKQGALDGLSIGYRVLDATPHPDKPGILSLKKLDLKEISVVTFAANDWARVDTVKSDERLQRIYEIVSAGGMPTERQFEKAMNALGFSDSKAVALSSVCKPILRGDPEAKADTALWDAMRAHLPG